MRRVVIIGGGYAGLHAFTQLSRRLHAQIDRDEVELTLVSRDPYHTYHGWTGEVLNGDLSVDNTLTPLTPILGTSFVQGEVVSADLDDNAIAVAIDGEVRLFPFDHLVIAAGSTDPFDRIPGLHEHGWCVKNSRDMQKLVVELDRWPESAGKPRNIVVVGGGLAGVETASALAARFVGAVGGKVNLHLVSSSDHLLPSLRPRFSRIADTAERTLAQQDVMIHSGRRVAQIHKDHVELADGSFLSADLAIVAAGVSFGVLPGTQALERNAAGQIIADQALRVRGHDNVWVAGDIAAVAHPSTGQPCPANALWAMKQGDCVGRNIARCIKGQSPGAFGFKGMGQAAGLAGQRGITELYGLQFSGRLAWTIRVLFFAWYMPSKRRSLPILSRLVQQFWASSAGTWSTDRRASPTPAKAEPAARRM